MIPHKTDPPETFDMLDMIDMGPMDPILEKFLRWPKEPITWHGDQGNRYFKATIEGENVICRVNYPPEEVDYTVIFSGETENVGEAKSWKLVFDQPPADQASPEFVQRVHDLMNKKFEWDGTYSHFIFRHVADGHEYFLRANSLKFDPTPLTVFNMDREVVNLSEVPKSWTICSEELGKPQDRY